MKKVLAGGAFNVIHKGHLYFLKECKKLGDFLVVVIASDKRVLENKGYLLKKSMERKKIVEKTGIADKVVIGGRDMLEVVKKEKPDIVALGYDQKLGIEGSLKKMGIEIVRIKRYGDYSTKKLKG